MKPASIATSHSQPPAVVLCAYRTTAHGITGIVAAGSRGQAIAATVRCAAEAGYTVAWTEVLAHRAPEHDAWAATAQAGRCWCEDCLPKGSEA